MLKTFLTVEAIIWIFINFRVCVVETNKHYHRYIVNFLVLNNISHMQDRAHVTFRIGIAKFLWLTSLAFFIINLCINISQFFTKVFFLKMYAYLSYFSKSILDIYELQTTYKYLNRWYHIILHRHGCWLFQLT